MPAPSAFVSLVPQSPSMCPPLHPTHIHTYAHIHVDIPQETPQETIPSIRNKWPSVVASKISHSGEAEITAVSKRLTFNINSSFVLPLIQQSLLHMSSSWLNIHRQSSNPRLAKQESRLSECDIHSKEGSYEGTLPQGPARLPPKNVCVASSKCTKTKSVKVLDTCKRWPSFSPLVPISKE